MLCANGCPFVDPLRSLDLMQAWHAACPADDHSRVHCHMAIGVAVVFGDRTGRIEGLERQAA